jgi:hypothetical protein
LPHFIPRIHVDEANHAIPATRQYSFAIRGHRNGSRGEMSIYASKDFWVLAVPYVYSVARANRDHAPFGPGDLKTGFLSHVGYQHFGNTPVET